MFIGNLTANPDLRYAPSGMGICKFSIACNESYLKDGKKEERVEFVRIVTFQKQAENCANYLHKGSLVYIEGRLRTRSWEDKEGNKKFATEVVGDNLIMLDKRNDVHGQSFNGLHGEGLDGITGEDAPPESNPDLPF